MTFPVIIFGFVISSLVGSLFHLWKGGHPGKLIFYIIMSWIGFWGGHILAGEFEWHFWDVGTLNMGMALPGSFLMAFFGYWIGLVRVQRTEQK